MGGPPRKCDCGDCALCRARTRRNQLRAEERAGLVNRDRICAADGCSQPFYATRRDKIYCSIECRNREAQRRFLKTDHAKEYARKWREANRDRQSAYARAWYERGGSEVRAAYKRQNREKARAHTAVLKAIERGTLTREPCEVCGAEVVDAHHTDYSKPLDVVWLCREHHIAVHRGGELLSQSK